MQKANLKTWFVISIIWVSMIPFAPEVAIADPNSYGRFTLTQGSYDCQSSMDTIVVNEFGPGAKVADWGTIKSLFSDDIASFCDSVGLTTRMSLAWCYCNGQAWDGWRHYFVQRHDHVVPPNWAVYDQIDNYFLDLGSWCYDWSAPILVELGTPVISFLDKKELSRKVRGAAADGASEVVIQITGLPEDITSDDVQISLPNGDEDGSLENDKEISNRVFTQTYVVPACFYPENLNVSERDIYLSVTVYGSQVGHDPFTLIRPPVIMVHGIWGHPTDFTELRTAMIQKGWKKEFLFAVNYNNVLSFSNPTVQQTLKDYISNTQRCLTDANIATSKVDIVAHSMGGLVAKTLDSAFARKKVRKIITIGTPYYGSPVADLVWSADTGLFYILEHIINTSVSFNQHSFTGGGLVSLLTTHKIPTQIPGVDCSNLVVGLRDGSLGQDLKDFFNLSGFISQLRLLKGMPPCSPWFPLCFSDQDVHDSIFGNGKESDWLVSLDSQKGDAPASGVVQKKVPWHAVEPKDAGVQELVIQVLNQPAQIGQVTGGLSASQHQGIGLQAQNVILPLEKMPFNQTTMSESNEPNGTVKIISPTMGQVCTAGGQITISVEGSGATTAAAIFALFGTSSWSDIVQLPWSGDINVPPDSVGSTAQIYVIGLDTNMKMTGTDSVDLVLDSNIVLQGIFFGFGEKWYFDFKNNPQQAHQFQLYPEGSFSNGSVYPLSVVGAQTVYSSSDPAVVTVDANGLVTAIAAGSGVITITNSAITAHLNVAVQGYTGDINIDGIVNFKDFAILAAQWGNIDCGEPTWCGGADLDHNGIVAFADLAVLSQHWLEGI